MRNGLVISIIGCIDGTLGNIVAFQSSKFNALLCRTTLVGCNRVCLAFCASAVRYYLFLAFEVQAAVSHDMLASSAV